MDDAVGLTALLLTLVYNAWQLNEIRKISRACYVELTMTRWETGRSGRSQQSTQSSPALGGQRENLAK
jgi:hypothetical protein